MTFFNLMGLIWHNSAHITQIAKEVGISKASVSLLSVPYEIKNHFLQLMAIVKLNRQNQLIVSFMSPLKQLRIEEEMLFFYISGYPFPQFK